MPYCPNCGCDLAKAMRHLLRGQAETRQRRVDAVRGWQDRNRAKYNAYQRRYQKKYRARKRETNGAVVEKSR
jgi:hypothetical protein